MCAIYVELLCADKFGLGWAHDAFLFACHMFMHFHAYIPSILYILIYLLVLFWLSRSLPLSLSCVSLLYGTQMQIHTVLEPFSKNFSRWGIHLECQVILSDFYNTDLPTVIYSRVGGHCVTSRSLVPLWSYRIFTPICMDLILLYLISSLTFEVRAL